MTYLNEFNKFRLYQMKCNLRVYCTQTLLLSREDREVIFVSLSVQVHHT